MLFFVILLKTLCESVVRKIRINLYLGIRATKLYNENNLNKRRKEGKQKQTNT